MKPTITTVILAGGKGRRLEGKDKGLMIINGKPAIEYILNIVPPLSHNIIISANRNLEQYRRFGFPVMQDSVKDYQGPLAGILTALQTANTDYILTIPCDCPLINHDFLRRMSESLQQRNNSIIVAHDGERLQQLHALIPVSFAPDLQTYLLNGKRRVDQWYQQHDTQLVDFSDNPDLFYNTNTQEDIVQLATRMKKLWLF